MCLDGEQVCAGGIHTTENEVGSDVALIATASQRVLAKIAWMV